METIRGRTPYYLDSTELNARLTNYHRIILDLGTGDGRYVRHLAEDFPRHFIIGVDSCRENLRKHSRVKLPNMLFAIASAQNLPCELNGLISHITINFPWGSLLESLLKGDSSLMCGLASISRPATTMEVRLNGGALAEANTTLEAGTERIYNNLLCAGWQVKEPEMMKVQTLCTFPTTWARRLAHGRDPRAMVMNGCVACK